MILLRFKCQVKRSICSFDKWSFCFKKIIYDGIALLLTYHLLDSYQ